MDYLYYFLIILACIAVGIIVFLIFRWLVLWYWKIDKIVENLQIMTETNKKILKEISAIREMI